MEKKFELKHTTCQQRREREKSSSVFSLTSTPAVLACEGEREGKEMKALVKAVEKKERNGSTSETPWV